MFFKNVLIFMMRANRIDQISVEKFEMSRVVVSSGSAA